MPNHKISVVLPCYNQIKYVAKSIDSVLGQSYKNIELILIDNVSTDGTKEALKEYEKKDSRVKCIYHKKNTGFTSSINDGFAAATGHFVAIQNSDDNWHPNKLEEQVKIFDKYPEVGVVVSDAGIIDQHGKSSGSSFSEEMKQKDFGLLKDAFQKLCENNFCCHSSIIFKGSLISSGKGYDLSLKYAPDWWFLLTVTKKHKLYYVQEKLLDYRVHPSNLSKNKDVVYNDMVLIRKRLAELGINKTRNLISAAIYSSLLRDNKNAKKFASQALLGKNLSMKDKVLMKFIIDCGSAGLVLLKLNRLRVFSRDLLHKIKR